VVTAPGAGGWERGRRARRDQRTAQLEVGQQPLTCLLNSDHDKPERSAGIPAKGSGFLPENGIDDRRAVTVAAHMRVQDLELVIVQVAAVPTGPLAGIEHQPDRPDAEEIWCEQVAVAIGVTAEFDVSPALDEVEDLMVTHYGAPFPVLTWNCAFRRFGRYLTPAR
jgi:hypothetical protein